MFVLVFFLLFFQDEKNALQNCSKRNRRFVRLKRPFNETRRRFAHAKTPSCFSELGTNSHASAQIMP